MISMFTLCFCLWFIVTEMMIRFQCAGTNKMVKWKIIRTYINKHWHFGRYLKKIFGSFRFCFMLRMSFNLFENLKHFRVKNVVSGICWLLLSRFLFQFERLTNFQMESMLKCECCPTQHLNISKKKNRSIQKTEIREILSRLNRLLGLMVNSICFNVNHPKSQPVPFKFPGGK